MRPGAGCYVSGGDAQKGTGQGVHRISACRFDVPDQQKERIYFKIVEFVVGDIFRHMGLCELFHRYL